MAGVRKERKVDDGTVSIRVNGEHRRVPTGISIADLALELGPRAGQGRGRAQPRGRAALDARPRSGSRMATNMRSSPSSAAAEPARRSGESRGPPCGWPRPPQTVGTGRPGRNRQPGAIAARDPLDLVEGGFDRLLRLSPSRRPELGSALPASPTAAASRCQARDMGADRRPRNPAARGRARMPPIASATSPALSREVSTLSASRMRSISMRCDVAPHDDVGALAPRGRRQRRSASKRQHGQPDEPHSFLLPR